MISRDLSDRRATLGDPEQLRLFRGQIAAWLPLYFIFMRFLFNAQVNRSLRRIESIVTCSDRLYCHYEDTSWLFRRSSLAIAMPDKTLLKKRRLEWREDSLGFRWIRFCDIYAQQPAFSSLHPEYSKGAGLVRCHRDPFVDPFDVQTSLV